MHISDATIEEARQVWLRGRRQSFIESMPTSTLEGYLATRSAIAGYLARNDDDIASDDWDYELGQELSRRRGY